MSRNAILATALGAVVLLVVAFMFLIKPKMDEVAELEAEAESLQQEQSQVRSQIAVLEEVRATSPDLEAELAAMSAVIPESPALPAALRQLQQAADDAGLQLISVAPGRPTSANVEEFPDLSAIPLNLSVEGGYFQVVDFLRRLEAPAITARGILVTSLSVSPGDYPTLSVTVTGQMFSLLEDAAPAAPEPTPTETPTDDETDVDVDVDVDVTEEDAA